MIMTLIPSDGEQMVIVHEMILIQMKISSISAEIKQKSRRRQSE